MQSENDKLKEELKKTVTEFKNYKDCVMSGTFVSEGNLLLEENPTLKKKLEGALDEIRRLRRQVDPANEDFKDLRNDLQFQIDKSKAESGTLKLDNIKLKDTYSKKFTKP